MCYVGGMVSRQRDPLRHLHVSRSTFDAVTSHCRAKDLQRVSWLDKILLRALDLDLVSTQEITPLEEAQHVINKLRAQIAERDRKIIELELQIINVKLEARGLMVVRRKVAT